MNEFGNNIEINNKNYNYRIINIHNLSMFLEVNKLKLSFEAIIKEHKHDYTINKLIEDGKKTKKNTKIFILYYNNLVTHIERFVYAQNRKSMYLDFIHTHSNYRKMGIGNTSLYYLLKNTKKYFKIYELKVRKGNEDAIKLYIKHNFKIISSTFQKNENDLIEILIMKLIIK
jgi:ribosomal protein S18 acetylase RimI-like enzyme